MPIYDFECKECGNRFEVWCKISEREDEHPCPMCKSKHTSNKITTNDNNFKLRGEGWHGKSSW